jgi:signal transduction histidine kinase/DNA-binding response OmpR family regulator
MSGAIRILHLEDDAADARLIREQLLRSGLDVSITVADGREAFAAAIRKGEFDIVLSDYRVPQFNGLEALEYVRSAGVQVPFILVTGALGDEGAIELLHSGATDCVLKDRLARLAPAIQRALSEDAARKHHAHVQLQLIEANQLSKLAAEAARLGTWQLDVASGKLTCSDEFLNLINARKAEWAGTIEALEAVMHPEDVATRRRVHAHSVAHGLFMELEFRVEMPDGEVRWMHLRGDCSHESEKVRSTYIGVMMDITERKKLEEALREADRRKDEFLATLAHELRNPLAPIYNGLSVLRQSVESAEQTQIHAMLERQTNHMIRLVDDLMDVSRYTMGKIELKLVPIELQTVLRHAIEMSQPFIGAGRHQLDLSVPAEPVMLQADGVRVAQVLSNLLNNAAKYTADAGHIWLSAQVENSRAVISVRDNGRGIPTNMLNRVFDLFTQVDSSRGTPGLGIGLAMVRMLVELHGGDVEARSPGPGHGSEFIVRLPILPDINAGTKSKAAGTETSLEGRSVLVVDDNCDAADSLSMLLRLAGAKVTVAYDGASALAAVPIHQPDVVLLDVGMPGMDGYTVASRIRQDLKNSDMLLIALTGFGQEEDRKRSTAAGFNDHLTKPADLQALLSLVASFEPVAAAREKLQGKLGFPEPR